MERDPKPARRVPRGPALNSADDELDAAAEITEADVEDALSTWRRDAPRGERELLDAGGDDDGR